MVGKICKIRAQPSLNAANAKKKKVLGLKGFGGTSKMILLPQTDAPETKYPREQ